jgi:hypothetical protein
MSAMGEMPMPGGWTMSMAWAWSLEQDRRGPDALSFSRPDITRHFSETSRMKGTVGGIFLVIFGLATLLLRSRLSRGAVED